MHKTAISFSFSFEEEREEQRTCCELKEDGDVHIMNEEGDADILIISGSLEDDNGWAEASVGTQLLVADHQIASLTSSPSEKRRRASPHSPLSGDVEMLGHAMMRERCRQ